MSLFRFTFDEERASNKYDVKEKLVAVMFTLTNVWMEALALRKSYARTNRFTMYPSDSNPIGSVLDTDDEKDLD